MVLSLNEPACCDLGRITTSPYPEPPPHTVTDICGFTYRLCALHYHAWVTGLAKARHARPSATALHRPWHRNRPTRRILAGDNQ